MKKEPLQLISQKYVRLLNWELHAKNLVNLKEMDKFFGYIEIIKTKS